MAFNPNNYKAPEAKKLPVILLLDVSGSMSGAKIDSLYDSTIDMIETFAAAQAKEQVIDVAIITFGNGVDLHTRYTPVKDLQTKGISKFKASGMTPMGTALRMAKDMIDDKNENNDNSYSRKTNRVKSDLPDLSYNPHPKDNRNRFGEKPTKKEIENFMNFSKRDEIEYTEDKVILGTDSELDNSHFDEIKNAKIVQDDETKVRTLPDLKVLAQIFKTYILSEADNKLYLIDQHAAAERYNYEKLQREFSERKNYKKQMLIPLMFDFSVEEAAEVRNNLEKFEELGIVFEEFGDNSYVVREFPGWIEEDEEEMIKIIVEKVLKNNNITFNELRNDAIAMASCKMSIKANQILNEVEMNKVISDLYECRNPFTCPHGRPIITKMEKKDLEKMFKRIV